jgi:DsbC/DsbD-like thiol-disulfide interchange protein
MRSAMRLIASALMLLFSAVSAQGGATGWVELAPDTRIRLIASETWSAEGKTLLALELDMPMNTKTYWRVPGESGIPTELDFAGSSGVAAHDFIWPYPLIERKGGYTDFVFYGPTVIPIELSVESSRPVIKAAVLMGICSDICVPATAAFSLTLDIGIADPGQNLRIAQAMALTPLPWDGQPEPIGEVGLDPVAGTLRVAVDPDVVDPSSVIADASAAGYLLGAPQKSPEPGVVVLPILGGGDGSGLGGQSIRFTFMTRDGPYEAWRSVAP